MQIGLSGVLGLFSVATVAFAQSHPQAPVLPPATSLRPPLVAPGLTHSNAVRVAPTVSTVKTNLVIPGKALALLNAKKFGSDALPKPGIYKTAPYTCLVLVPGSTPDDPFVIKPPTPEPPMLKIEPKLEFIPR